MTLLPDPTIIELGREREHGFARDRHCAELAHAADGKVFDLVEPAYDRYVQGSGERKKHGSLEVESSGPNGGARFAPADTSQLSVSIALDERRLAMLDRSEITRNSDWD